MNMCMISAAADEQLKRQGLLAASAGRPLISTEDQQKRANAIEAIDSEGFAQSTFRSTRSEVRTARRKLHVVNVFL